jgi:hypothetical protein
MKSELSKAFNQRWSALKACDCERIPEELKAVEKTQEK